MRSNGCLLGWRESLQLGAAVRTKLSDPSATLDSVSLSDVAPTMTSCFDPMRLLPSSGGRIALSRAFELKKSALRAEGPPAPLVASGQHPFLRAPSTFGSRSAPAVSAPKKCMQIPMDKMCKHQQLFDSRDVVVLAEPRLLTGREGLSTVHTDQISGNA